MSKQIQTSNWGLTPEENQEMEAKKKNKPFQEMLDNPKVKITQEKGKKYDNGKPMMNLLPPEGLNEVAKVLTFGATKYGAHNWRSGLAYSRLLSASIRHLNSFNKGVDIDPESGISHLAHAACNLLMLIEYQALDLGEDDRWRK